MVDLQGFIEIHQSLFVPIMSCLKTSFNRLQQTYLVFSRFHHLREMWILYGNTIRENVTLYMLNHM